MKHHQARRAWYWTSLKMLVQNAFQIIGIQTNFESEPIVSPSIFIEIFDAEDERWRFLKRQFHGSTGLSEKEAAVKNDQKRGDAWDGHCHPQQPCSARNIPPSYPPDSKLKDQGCGRKDCQKADDKDIGCGY
jgi:hypothetical protein